jgi:MoaA/NifB/PqqE/SkfB family radical SAM enzyme
VQLKAYRWFEATPVKYGNAVIVLDMFCNSSCGMCSSWSTRTLPGTLTVEQWRTVVDKLHRHNRDMKISFVGGEPLLVEGLVELLEYTRSKGIVFSIVTNGTLLTQERALEILSTKPLALHVSLDSLQPPVYKRIRGIDAVETVKANIDTLTVAARGTGTHLGIKSTVTEFNVEEVDALAVYAQEKGMGIHFQPVLADNKVAKRIMRVDMDSLTTQATSLAAKVESGQMRHVANNPAHIRTWARYFREEETQRDYCPTALQNLFIQRDGGVKLCERYDTVIGNIYSQDVRSIIRSPAAVELRKTTFGCKRNCTFIYKRGLRDYLRIFAVMTRRRPHLTADLD